MAVPVPAPVAAAERARVVRVAVRAHVRVSRPCAQWQCAEPLVTAVLVTAGRTPRVVMPLCGVIPPLLLLLLMMMMMACALAAGWCW